MNYSVFKEFLHGFRQYLPAKSGSKMHRGWLPVWAHLLDTAGIMELLLSEWAADPLGDRQRLSDPDWKKVCVFIVLVHDIGKFTPLFQKKIVMQMPGFAEKIQKSGLELPLEEDFFEPGKTPHGMAGEAILCHLGCPEGIASVVGAHHGRPQEVGTDIADLMEMYEENFYGFDGENSPEGEKWKALWEEWLNLSLAGCGYDSLEDLPLLGIPDQVLASGLLIMADWIASNPNFFPLLEMEEGFDSLSYPQRIESAWQALSLPERWLPTTYYMGMMDFRERFGFDWNTVQQSVVQAIEESRQPGIFILEAQMGVGKTEASLAGAELLASKFGKKGMYFGLPTQATANGIFPRLKQWAQQQSESAQHGIMLAHGMAELNEDFQAIFHGRAIQNEDGSSKGLIVHPWFEGRKQALLSDFVIGTVDQLLMAALKQKHVMMRHLGLAGKVVVIDECHAYDAYMNRYLDRALNWLGYYKVPVILLSATLPARRRMQLVQAYQNFSPKQDQWHTLQENEAYPLLTWTDGAEVHQRDIPVDQPEHVIRIRKADRDQISVMVEEAVSRGGCVGIIMNTVFQAQQLARELKRDFPGNRVILIHSRFLMAERAEREAQLLQLLGKGSSLEQRRGLIVVGTQILEQSLDIDFDFLITQTCPMDLLLQRIGRLHRHRRNRPEGLENAVCAVLDTESPDDGTKAVYGEWLLYQTARLLPEKIRLPGDISGLVQAAYREGTEFLTKCDPAWPLWTEQKRRIDQKERKAMGFRIPAPDSLDQTLHGLLDSSLDDSELAARASVRDGDPGIEVLVMELKNSGEVSFLSCQQNPITVPGDHIPSREECRRILRQRLRLPAALTGRSTEETIASLEQVQQAVIPEWSHTPLLSGELFLFLDEQGTAMLGNRKLSYTKELGLQYERKET